VHIDHGIGRYLGLKTLDVNQAPARLPRDPYGGDSKLYLPVENIDLLTRYGAEGEGVQLDRPGRRRLAEPQGARPRKRPARDGRGPDQDRRPPAHEAPPRSSRRRLFDEFCARFPYERPTTS
jgi:transcription-repair coupling factor (superfamily II helicase)